MENMRYVHEVENLVGIMSIGLNDKGGEQGMCSNEQILSYIMRLSTDSSVVMSVRDMESDDIVSHTCIVNRGSLSSGEALSSATKYEQMRRILSSASNMSEPVLSIISREDGTDRASYCLFVNNESFADGWHQMSRWQSKKFVIDTIASLRLWLAYPRLRHAKLPVGRALQRNPRS